MADGKTGLGSLVAGVGFLLLGGGCATWAGTFLMIGAIFVVVFPLVVGLPFDDLRLDRGTSLHAPGHVLWLEIVPNTSFNEQDVYTLTYSFDVDGNPVEDSVRALGLDALSHASPGAPLEVEYLAEDPSISRPEGTLANPAGWVGLLGVPFVLLGLVGLVPVVLAVAAGVWLIARAVRVRRES